MVRVPVPDDLPMPSYTCTCRSTLVNVRMYNLAKWTLTNNRQILYLSLGRSPWAQMISITIITILRLCTCTHGWRDRTSHKKKTTYAYDNMDVAIPWRGYPIQMIWRSIYTCWYVDSWLYNTHTQSLNTHTFTAVSGTSNYKYISWWADSWLSHKHN